MLDVLFSLIQQTVMLEFSIILSFMVIVSADAEFHTAHKTETSASSCKLI